MKMSAATFGLNLLSHASRERCMMNLKKFQIPLDKYGWKSSREEPKGTAAVLVPLCEVNDVTSLLYTVRSSSLRNHSGQISFPGGKTDKDETPIETALRETYEEIGLASDKIDIWGSAENLLDYKILRDKITPVIGCIKNFKQDDLFINQNEVNEVFTVSLETLSDPKNHYYTQFKNGFIVPVYMAGNFKIWGITGYITHVFLSCLLPKEIYKADWTKKKIEISDLK